MERFVLVDTDVIIDVGRDIDAAVQRLEREEKNAILGISIVTQMELLTGCRNKSELKAVERFVKRFQIINLNDGISNLAVGLLRSYRLSHGLLIADSLIAATALSMDAYLLSKNQKDYRFIQDLKLMPYPLSNKDAARKKSDG